MKKFLLIMLLSIAYYGYSQAPQPLCLGDTAIVCPQTAVQITNCATNAPSPAGFVMDNPTTVSLSDDAWSGAVPIGFPFEFYGNTYSNLLIGSNGLLTFRTVNPGSCSWNISSVNLPSTSFTSALNSIMIVYQDINPNLGGTIQYQTIGTAPNRMFVVLYSDIFFFDCISVCNNYGAVLYEGSNEIEFHVGNKPTCPSWGGGLAIQGIQNLAGTSAVITPGRNSSVWTVNQDSRRFTPSAAGTDYSLTQIPYTQINGTGGVISWVNTAGQSFPFNNGILNITNPPAGTTGYYLSGTACGAPLGGISDTAWIVTSAVNGTITKTPDFCSTNTGTATVTPTGDGPFTYLWSPSGQTTQTATGLGAGVQTLLITNAHGCSTPKSTIIFNNTITTSGTTTVVSCPGGNDGTATAMVTPVQTGTTYNWFEDGGQTTATATGLSAGVHRVEIVSGAGCIDTLSLTVTELPGMVVTSTKTDVTCNSGNDGKATLNVTLGTGPYTYVWDKSVSTVNVATDLVVGTHAITITDSKGCVISTTVTLDEPNPLDLVYITPDLITCIEDSASLSATALGGSIPSAYTYTWTQGGVEVGVGQTIKVKVPASGTQYCVKVTEACGSPAADTCMTVTFPTELYPSITADMDAKCQPANFTLTNETNDPGEIFSTRFMFGNGENDSIVAGNNAVSMDYPKPGTYTVDVLITSVHGCVYAKSFPSLLRTIKKPTASFTTSSNPATIFETTIQMQNNSSQGVVDWKWSSPGASPATSTIANPTFQYPEEVGDYPIQLIVETAEGCIDTVNSVIHIVSDIIFFAPNAFTPDGNEFNQTWNVVTDGIDIFDFQMRIFNRWGEQVWESHNPLEGWDGTYNGEIMKEGTYIFVSRVKDLHSDSHKTFKGHITLIR